ncbi:MAG: RNA polymerase sigma-70 factor [Chitinophaga sp.]|uniref:RNA polymerase sigma-70 factor n=1 Tax=Chitinophaga sp. TaxID=1869181 RepID=UPI001B1F2A32|nr:RNA polymerase sigma-70 factor [Chitinophaga sp.]MBO9732124.1 RNA polymerase sigma-70 factor [Chitinophaga sp.]
MHQPGSDEAVSFEEQFRLHCKYLCAVAYHMVKDEEIAMDIVQDFFLNYWKKRDVLQIRHDFRSYAAYAIRNTTLNYLKKNGKLKLMETRLIEELMEYAPEEDRTEEERRNAALWEAINRLPEQRRRIFLLSNHDGLKYKEIAEALDISINTVKTQIKLALQFMRKECGWMVNASFLVLFLRMITAFTLFSKLFVLITSYDAYK